MVIHGILNTTMAIFFKICFLMPVNFSSELIIVKKKKKTMCARSRTIEAKLLTCNRNLFY